MPHSSVSRFVAALAIVVAILGSALQPASGDEQLSPEAQQGLAIIRANCARCHAIYKVGESPLKAAPPFRTLHLRYPVESLEEALGEGIITGHPAMPEFRFNPDQVGDVIDYLKSLER